MRYVRRFFKALLRASFIVSLLIGSPFAHGEISDTFKPYINDYMFFTKTDCTDKQYRSNLIMTMNFGDLSKYKNKSGEVESLAGLTSSYQYQIIGTNIIMYYADIVIDEKTWKEMNLDAKYALIFHELTHAYFNYPDLKDEKYRHHFMYSTVDTVSMKETKRQIVELLGILCHK